MTPTAAPATAEQGRGRFCSGPNEIPAHAREIYRRTDCGTCGWGLCEQSQQGGEDDDFGDAPFPPGQQIEGEQSDDGGAPGKDTVYQIVCSAQVNHDGGDDSQCRRAHACHDIFQRPTVLELFKEYGFTFLPDKISSFLRCANILVKDDRQKELRSYNSDYMGVKSIIEIVGKQKELKHIAVVGAGGAGKAAAMAVADCGIELSVINRTNMSSFCTGINTLFCRQNGAAHLASFCSINDYQAVSLILSRTDMVIYTIPKEAGNMREQLLANPQPLLEANYANPAFSTLYNEKDLYISGKEWLLRQAVPAFKIFTGAEPCIESMRNTFK